MNTVNDNLIVLEVPEDGYDFHIWGGNTLSYNVFEYEGSKRVPILISAALRIVKS